MSDELSASVLELSNLGGAHAPDRVTALVAISRRQGTPGHITRWALALFLSVFVVYMNTATVLNQPPAHITNAWHIRLLAFHQNVGLVYFALMVLMPVLGGSLMLALKLRSSELNGSTHRAQIRRLRGRNMLARFEYRERNRLAHTPHLMAAAWVRAGFDDAVRGCSIIPCQGTT